MSEKIQFTKQQLKEYLNERGIDLKVDSCGCCRSPWVTIKIDGQEVWDTEGESINTEES